MNMYMLQILSCMIMFVTSKNLTVFLKRGSHYVKYNNIKNEISVAYN